MPTITEAAELVRAVDEVESLVERVDKARDDVWERQTFLDKFGDKLAEIRARIAAGKTTAGEEMFPGDTQLTIAAVLAYDCARFKAELDALTGLLDRWDEIERRGS